ncbi:MAG: hypothetical protein KDD25_01290, partial [Bdellovibrionales bacterium]|nr:hypothetical protein [Bdellovibrionales bacterium]
KIIDAILDGSIDHCEWEKFPMFGFEIPKSLNGVNTEVLNPRNTWENKSEYDQMLSKLAEMFSKNFTKYTDVPAGKRLANAGPKLSTLATEKTQPLEA